MGRKLKVLEFSKKANLVRYVNKYADSIEIVSISSSRAEYFYNHFLWYYKVGPIGEEE